MIYKIGTRKYTKLEAVLMAIISFLLFGVYGFVVYGLYAAAWYPAYVKKAEEKKPLRLMNVILVAGILLFLFGYMILCTFVY